MNKNRRSWLAVARLAVGLLPWVLLNGCGYANPDPVADAKLAMKLREVSSAAGGATPTQNLGEGWGRLRGRFVYSGDPPHIIFADTGGKDPAACGVRPIPANTLTVDPQTKGIRDVVVFLRRAPRVKEPEGQLPEQVFDQKDCIFLSHVFVCRTGIELIIKNSDPVAHNTNCAPPGDVSFNPLMPAMSEFRVTFKRSQTAPVPTTCSIHPFMKAYIFPRADGYAVATKADGTFEIADLPAGVELEFEVWHEAAAGAQGRIDGGGISKGRFKVTIPNGGEAVKDVTLPPSAFKL
jgi:hypothetical protein